MRISISASFSTQISQFTDTEYDITAKTNINASKEFTECKIKNSINFIQIKLDFYW